MTRGVCLTIAVMLTAAALPAALLAQAQPDPQAVPDTTAAQAVGPTVVSTEVSVQRNRASLVLELQDGRVVTYALDNGDIYVDGTDVGDYTSGDALDRAWRGLLGDAMEADPATVAGLLTGWQAPTPGGEPLDRALEALFAGQSTATVATPALTQPSLDSIEKLEARLREMERQLEHRAEDDDRSVGDYVAAPFRWIWRGLAALLGLAALWAVLSGLGALSVLVAKKNLDNVAETARTLTLRSWLVGLAGSFLLLPVYVLGMIALAITIVGIPLLLVWAPLFPVAVVLAALFGYIAVADATGEALAVRRLDALRWLRYGNSYYHIMAGFALLLVLFAVAHVVTMAGPWFHFVHALLIFLAVVVTWVAFTIGLGAFLLSRAGTRPPEVTLVTTPETGLEEETHV